MSKAFLTRRLATVTNRAVAQFAAEKNEAAHDRQWGKSIAPHPDKEGMATTFIINECISNNGVFPRESVATLCNLDRW